MVLSMEFEFEGRDIEIKVKYYRGVGESSDWLEPLCPSDYSVISALYLDTGESLTDEELYELEEGSKILCMVEERLSYDDEEYEGDDL